MKVCLATLHAQPKFIPLALLYLKAYLVEHDQHPVDHIPLLEFTRETPHDDMVRQILATEAAVVGLSCYFWNIKKLMPVAAELKERAPHIKIILGGPEVGPIAADVIRAHPCVDAIVRSEGEITFAEIVATIARGGDLAEVRGITLRRGDEIIETEAAPILTDLNQLPSPLRIAQMIDTKGRYICLETQRGCVFKCNFCYYNKEFSIRNRRFELDRVKSEILFWLQQDIGELYLMDPIFNLNAERAKEICRFVAEHNHRKIEIHSEVWAEFIDEELARLMRAANFQFLEVGLQSTDKTALMTIERRLRQERFEEGISYLKKYEHKFELQLIYGLPGETLSSFLRSLTYAYDLEAWYLEVFPLMVLPGTELWKKADALEIDFEREPPYKARSHKTMTPADFEYGAKVIDAVRRLAQSKTFRLLCREPGLDITQVVDEWIAWRAEETIPEYVEPDVKQFLAHLCAKRSIAPEFYQGFASWEFRN